MAPAPAVQREAVGLAAIVIAILAVRWRRRRRATRDEGRQRIDRGGFALRRARLVALLGRSAFARGLLIRLRLAWHERLCVRRQIGLRLARPERGLAERLLIVVAVFEIVVVARLKLLVVAFRARSLEVRILLAELLLRDRDQAEIVLGMLEVIFSRNRIAGRLRIARELKIFVCDMVGRATDFDVGTVRFVNPSQVVVTAAIVVLLIVAPAHTLMVLVLMLTVSHGFVFNNSR
jgi:hypothetical protein